MYNIAVTVPNTGAAYRRFHLYRPPPSPPHVPWGRFFANKLWNAGRFLLGNLKDLSAEEREALAVTGPLTAEEVCCTCCSASCRG